MPAQKTVYVAYATLILLQLTCPVYGLTNETPHSTAIIGDPGSWVTIYPTNIADSPLPLRKRAKLEFTIARKKPLDFNFDCYNTAQARVKFSWRYGAPLRIRWNEADATLEMFTFDSQPCPKPNEDVTTPVNHKGSIVGSGTPVYIDWLWNKAPDPDILFVQATQACTEVITITYETSYDGVNYGKNGMIKQQPITVSFYAKPLDLQADINNDGVYGIADDSLELDPGWCIPWRGTDSMLLNYSGIRDDFDYWVKFTYNPAVVQISGIGSDGRLFVPSRPISQYKALSVKGLSPGVTLITASIDLNRDTNYNNDGPDSQDSVLVKVVDVDMCLAGLPDEEEYDPGPGGKIPIDTVKELTIRCPRPSDIDRTVRLNIETTGIGNVRIYEDREFTRPVRDGQEFIPSPGNLITLYVWGEHVSIADKDITLRLTHVQTGADDKIAITVTNYADGVEKVVKDSQPYEEGPLYVPVDGLVPLRALPNPSDKRFVGGLPQWTVEKPSGSGANPEFYPPKGAATVLSGLSVAGGPYVVWAEYNNFASVDIYVVNGVLVDRIIKAGSDPEQQGPLYVHVDDSLTLEAIPTPPNPAFPPDQQPLWSTTEYPTGANPPLPCTGPTITLSSLSLSVPGKYVVKATGSAHSSDTIVVHVVERVTVDRVVDNSNPGDQGPLWVNPGAPVTLLAIPSPSTGDYLPGEPVWTIDTHPSGASPRVSSESGPTTTLSNLSIAGEYIIRAFCGNYSDGYADTISVVVLDLGVEKIVRQGTNDQGPLSATLGGSVPLEAKPSPAGATFPGDEPAWTLAQPAGGEAGFTAPRGPLTTLTGLSMPGRYTVTASCNGHSKTIYVDVAGVKIIPEGADSIAYCAGVTLEDGLLSAIGYPSGGFYQWTIQYVGNGRISAVNGLNNSDLRIRGVTPSSAPEDVRLTVTYTYGTSIYSEGRNLSVVTPTYTTSVMGGLNNENPQQPKRKWYHVVLDQFRDSTRPFEHPFNVSEIVQWIPWSEDKEGHRIIPTQDSFVITLWGADLPWPGGRAIKDTLGTDVVGLIESKCRQELKVEQNGTMPYYTIIFDTVNTEGDRIWKEVRSEW